MIRVEDCFKINFICALVCLCMHEGVWMHAVVHGSWKRATGVLHHQSLPIYLKQGLFLKLKFMLAVTDCYLAILWLFLVCIGLRDGVTCVTWTWHASECLNFFNSGPQQRIGSTLNHKMSLSLTVDNIIHNLIPYFKGIAFSISQLKMIFIFKF